MFSTSKAVISGELSLFCFEAHQIGTMLTKNKGSLRPLDDQRHIRVVVTRVLDPPASVLARTYWQDLVIRGTLAMSFSHNFSGYCKKTYKWRQEWENMNRCGTTWTTDFFLGKGRHFSYRNHGISCCDYPNLIPSFHGTELCVPTPIWRTKDPGCTSRTV